MPNKNTQALNRLVKKLNALRKTLRKEERELLDQLIVGPESEVAGHQITVPSKPQGAVMGATLRAKQQQPEVEGHALYDNAKLAKRQPQAASAKRQEQPEVEGHRLSITPAANAPQRAASAKREEEPEVEGHAATLITPAANAPQRAASAKREEEPEVEGHQILVPTASSGPRAAVTIMFDAKKREYVVVIS